MEDTGVKKLPPIKFTKRIGHIFEHVRDQNNIEAAIIDALKHFKLI